MTISLLHPCYQNKENYKMRNDLFAKNTENTYLIIDGHTLTFSTFLLVTKLKKGMILSSARWLEQVLFPDGLILSFPNFKAKNWQKQIVFQFLKKQGDKIFF